MSSESCEETKDGYRYIPLKERLILKPRAVISAMEKATIEDAISVTDRLTRAYSPNSEIVAICGSAKEKLNYLLGATVSI